MLNKTALLVLVLLCAVAGLYGQFLWNPAVFDDLLFFVHDATGQPALQGYSYSPFALRSLPYATLAWGNAIFGPQMLHYRIENLLLHMAVIMTVFLFLRRIFEVLLIDRNEKLLSAGGLAFVAALLFALHPVAVYAVGYLVQRSILMATLFSVLAMLAWMRGCEHGNGIWLWASVSAYYLAVFSKEHAIMLPAVLLALTVLLHKDWQRILTKYWPQLLGFVLIAVIVLFAKRGIFGTTYEIYAPDMLVESGDGLNYPLSVLTQGWLFFKYAALWLMPNPNWMSVDMREPFASSVLSGYLVAFSAFLAWGGVACWLLFKRGRSGLLGFAMLYPWLMFMTEFSTIRIQENFVLYRSYLWVVGALAFVPFLLDLLDKQIAKVLVLATALAMFPISMDRLASFSHPLILWDDAGKLVKGHPELPGAYRIYYNRGTEFIKIFEFDAGIEDLKRSVKLQPDWPFSYNNLGAAYSQIGAWQDAVAAFGKAIDIADRRQMGMNAQPYYGRAIAYDKLGMTELAQKDYEISCKFGKRGCDKLTK